MKADNLFRFVAIRPPLPQVKINRLVGDGKTVTDVGDLVKVKLEKDKLRPDQARLAAGRDLIKGNHYFTAKEWGKALAASIFQAQALLQKMEQELDLEFFRDKALELLTSVNHAGRQLKPFLTSDEYSSFKQTLWLSFYATVLNPYERPQDREIITTWLLLLHLLEADTEKVFKTRLQYLRRTRLAVPHSFFAITPAREEPEQPMERPEDPLKKRREEIQVQVAKLYEARRMLSDLFVAKLQRFEQMETVEKPVESAEPDKERTPIATRARSSVDLLRATPWQITSEDLKTYAESMNTVRTAGIVPELVTLPEVINRLDTEIASLSIEASALGEREELMLIGKSFVQVRRPHVFKYDVEGNQ